MPQSPQTSPQIGFIGLGAMGLPMASNLVRKGFTVAAFDIDAARLARLAALGARAAASAADAVAGADVAVTMLPAPPHVRAVALGPDGIVARLAPGSVLMDMSTIDPETTDALAAACRERGLLFVDAPVGRLASHAERGESLFMVGAGDTGFARVEPLLQAMGTTIHRCGPEGSGTRMKLVNNFMALALAQASAEAIVLGTRLGLSVEIMKEVTGGTSATNGQFQMNFATKSLRGDTAPGFSIDLAHKDMGLALAAAAQNRLGLPVGQATHAVLGAARSGDYAGKDFSALLDYACEINHIAVPRLKP